MKILTLVLQLSCCPSKQGELSKNILQNPSEQVAAPPSISNSYDCIRNVRAIGLTVEMLQARLSIIDLLLIGLDKPAPSLSHFLLGFDLKKQPSSVSGHGVARSELPDFSLI